MRKEGDNVGAKVKERPSVQALSHKDDEVIAQFFEEHDPLQFLDETEPAQSEGRASPLVQVNFRLPENALHAIQKIAKHLGIRHTTLIRLWVMEKLHERLEALSQRK